MDSTDLYNDALFGRQECMEKKMKDHPDFHDQYIKNVCKDFLENNITEEELKADIFNEGYRIIKLNVPDWLLEWAGENPGAARMALIKEYMAEVDLLKIARMTDEQGRYTG